MISISESETKTCEDLALRVARLLRHEVGDLLQTIYSVVAILGERLSENHSQERRLLSDLKGRAELCKFELDAVVELLNEPRPKNSAVDLFPFLGSVVAKVRRRYPSLIVLLDGKGSLIVNADGQALTGTMTFLLLVLCQSARQQVRISLVRREDHVICQLERDGYSIGDDQQIWLKEPFATTQQALLGLALALMRHTIEPCGGSVTVISSEHGGPCVQVSIPVEDA